MRRSFSKELEEDREFEIGGMVFKFVYPYWKDGAELLDESLDVDQEPDSNGVPQAFSFLRDTEKAIKKMPMFLDPENDAHTRWKELAARKTDPVPRHQIAQLYRWLAELTSGFPTTPPLDSSPGDGSNGTPSVEEES